MDGDSRKRKDRVEYACEFCRIRKAKCDGLEPCSRCAKQARECVYQGRGRSNYVLELERKLRKYEQEGAIKEPAPENLPPISEIGSDPNGQIQEPTPTSDEGPPDAMGAVQTSTPQNSFFGSSSTVSFMQLVNAAVSLSTAEHRGIDKPRAQDSGCGPVYEMVCKSPEALCQVNDDDLVLPPRQVADKYVQWYFRFVYNLYPFLHQPSFMKVYEKIWTGDLPMGRDTTLLYCIVNLVFAFGCSLSPESATKKTSADTYFRRSRVLLNLDLLDAGSLILLQALLLMGQYLQATTSPAKCWTVVGLSVRVAQGLGLDKEAEVAKRASKIEQEVCRRLWYGCVVLDQTLAMTFGRQMAITSPYTTVRPSVTDDPLIRDRELVAQPADQPSIFVFFDQTIKLYGILAEILQNVYENSADAANSSRVTLLKCILGLDSKLAEFKSQIPAALRIENSKEIESMGPPFLRQANILHLRFWHIQVMLCRPILLPPADRIEELFCSDLATVTEQSVGDQCVQAALNIINLIYEFRDSPDIPAWWYTVYFVHTAAIVLLAAKLWRGRLKVDVQVTDRAWQKAMTILRSLESCGPSAGRCLRLLQIVHGKISRAIQEHSSTLVKGGLEVTMSPDTGMLFSILSDQTGSISDEHLEELLRLTAPDLTFESS